MNYWHRQARRNDIYENGVPVEPPGFEGWTFYVRPLTLWNTAYKSAALRISRADPEVASYLERLKADDYEPTEGDEAIDARMNRQCFIEGCLVRWDGVFDQDEQPLPFGPVDASDLFAFFPQLYRFLDGYVRDPRNFPGLDEAQKADIALGNFAPASSSSSELGGTQSIPSQATPTDGTSEPPKKSKRAARS